MLASADNLCKVMIDRMSMSGSRVWGGGTGGPDPPENHKKIEFSSNTGPDPLKNLSYQASIQCLAIICPPAKRHLMAFR